MIPLQRRSLGLFTLIVWFALTTSRAQTPYPSGEPYFTDNSLERYTITNAAQTGLSKVSATGPGFTEAWQLETKSNMANPWDIQLIRSIPRAVAKDDVAFVRFYARMTLSTQETGGAFLSVYAQSGPPNYEKSLSPELFLTGEWREFMLPFVWKAGYAANEASLVFAAGYRRQTIQIAAVDVVHYGKTVALASLPRSKSTYPGREADAAWRTSAAQRIELFRKGDFAVQAVDAQGNPLQGATVSVRMKRHAFEFGSALVMNRIVDDSQDSRIYRQKVLELFNAASTENDLKAPPWQGDWGPGYNQEQTLRGLRWLKEHGLALRGHVLVWPSWRNSPRSITQLHETGQDAKIPQQILDNIANVMVPTAPYLDEWDVENEPYDNHDIMDLFGRDIQAEWFKAARKHHPTARLFLNDYANDDQSRHAAKIASFVENVRYLRSIGAPIDGVGLQAHMGDNPTPPENLVATLNYYSTAAPGPIRITEFDVNTEDEDLQADYLRDFYTAVFSMDNVIGIQMWGFWERQHWLPKAAMYRADWSERPAVAAYKKLVFETFWTNLDGVADGQGEYRGRGFHGDYDVVVSHGGRTVRKTMRIEKGATLTTLRVPLETPRFVNVSTRGSARTGAQTLIGGFSIGGSQSKGVLVRGVGPLLRDFGLNTALAKPRVKVFRSGESTPLLTHDAWDGAADAAEIGAAITQVQATPLAPGKGDAALLAELPEGAYSVHVVGSDDGTGTALFEVYETSTSGRLLNLSTRVFVGTGGDVAIPGFVSSGPTAQRLLIRAVGPGLASLGVPGTLSRPYLKLYSGSTVIAANEGWQTSPLRAEIAAAGSKANAFPLATTSQDSALLVTLESGAFTIMAEGADGGTGVCLLEMYVVPE